MDPNDPTIAQLATVTGNAAITAIASFLFWRTAAAAPATQDRFGPITAVAIATGLAILGTSVDATPALSRADLLQGILIGLVSGCSAIGVYDVVKSKAGIG